MLRSGEGRRADSGAQMFVQLTSILANPGQNVFANLDEMTRHRHTLCRPLPGDHSQPHRTTAMMPDVADPFFEPYDRDKVAYGEAPSADLAAFLAQVPRTGKAFDLGAGAGRDTLALAAAGFDVTAIDLSDRGVARIQQRAKETGVAERIQTLTADIREVDLPAGSLAAVVATTVLDHIPAADAKSLWQRMCDSLRHDGLMYVEVHTIDDPGSDAEPGLHRDAPVSETADAVVNYFAANQLAAWAVAPESRLRILRYAERLEWDYTHGPEHLHGKAILLAVRAGHHPDWYGQPAAFPRRA